MLFPLYAVTPLLSSVIEKVRYRWIPAALIIVFITIIVYATKEDLSTLEGNVRFVLRRIPSFIIGYWMAPYVKEGKRIPLLPVLFIAIGVTVLLFVLERGLLYNSWILMISAFFIPVVTSLLLSRFSFIYIESFLNVIGKASLESYLTNSFLIGIAALLPVSVFGGNIWNGGYLLYSIIVFVGIIWALLSYKLVSYLQSRK